MAAGQRPGTRTCRPVPWILSLLLTVRNWDAVSPSEDTARLFLLQLVWGVRNLHPVQFAFCVG